MGRQKQDSHPMSPMSQIQCHGKGSAIVSFAENPGPRGMDEDCLPDTATSDKREVPCRDAVNPTNSHRYRLINAERIDLTVYRIVT